MHGTSTRRSAKPCYWDDTGSIVQLPQTLVRDILHARCQHIVLNQITGAKGVYLACDFGGPRGCAQPAAVVIKSWVSELDANCFAERLAYNTFQGLARPAKSHSGIPTLLASARDPASNVYVMAMQHLGPTLGDVRELLPKRRFDEKMVTAVAIQLVSTFKNLIPVPLSFNRFALLA